MDVLPLGQSWINTPQAPLQRAAVWNGYFYRFFGSDHGQVPSQFRPLSGDQACNALSQVIESLGGEHPTPQMLVRCLSQMWSSGYRPKEPYKDTFKMLAGKALQIPSPDKAFKSLVEFSGTQYDPSRAIRAQTIESANERLNQSRALKISQPTVVTFDGNVWTVKKEFVVESAIENVSQLLDPINWQRLAPFFKDTRRIELKKVDRKTGSWTGTLQETVSINWNDMTVQSFVAFLKIDYTVAGDTTRADYSLQYEQDGQIVVDDGYAEARREADQLTHYTGYKRLRFASSILNFVTPAVMSMFLEQEQDGLQQVLEQKAIMLPNVPERRDQWITTPRG